MKINFYATLRQITGKKTIELPLSESITVRELLNGLVTQYPELNNELFDNDGNLLSRVHVLINGRDAPYLEDALETKVTSRDTVNIFPAVGGG